MANRRIIFAALVPDFQASLRLAQTYGGSFWRCPNGHALPNRQPIGRCDPTLCVQPRKVVPGNARPSYGDHADYESEMDLMPLGLEAEVYKTQALSPEEANLIKARSEEALDLARAMGIEEARNALHPVPEIPKPPDIGKLSPKEYVKQRLQDISPWLLEMKIRQARFGSRERSDNALDELLDRSGAAPKKQAEQENLTGPLLLVNIGASPYDKQVQSKNVVQISMPTGPHKTVNVIPEVTHSKAFLEGEVVDDNGNVVDDSDIG